MPLTLRSNGTAGGLISASWWNDYYALMTGTMTDQPVTFGNNLTVQGANGIMFNGKLGVSSAADVMDASNPTIVYIKTTSSAGSVEFQFPNGTNSFQFISNAIVVPQWLGIKRQNGTKLAEFLGNGNFIISGSQLQTSGGSIATATGGTFDSFDVAEVFESDSVYDGGTVVCPGDDFKLQKCTHDNCHAALIVSKNPGLGLGVPDEAQNHNYVAMSGRVNVKTAQDIPPRSLVCSDGRGGVRMLRSGEGSFVLGFTLNSTSVIDGHPVVGVFLRPLFVTMKGS